MNKKDNKNTTDKNKSSLYNFFGVEKSDFNAKTDTIKEIREENYLKINTNNQFDIYDTEESDKKLNEIINYAEDLIQVKSNKEMLRKFVEYLFPKCEREPFIISKYISKKLIKSKKITKKAIEEKIEFFYSKRIELRYSQKYILTKENINNIGYILCYSYSKFEDKKINKADLIKYIKDSEKINVLNDFHSYCNNIGKIPQDINKLDYLENHKDDYLLPGEFLFLIGCFNYINVLEINMNEIKESKQQHNSDFYLFVITLLNIHHLLTLCDYIKINFYNEKIQNDIFNYFTDELNLVYKLHDRDLKKNKKIPQNEICRKRWDFENEYIITKNKFLPGEEINIDNTEQNYDNNLKHEETFTDYDKDSEFGDSQYNDTKDRTISLFNVQNSTFLKSQTFEANDFSLNFSLRKSMSRNLTFIDNPDKKIMDKYDELVNENKYILELMCIVILGFLRLKIKNLELILNDCYYK